MPSHISWQRIVIRCAVTANYGHFLCGRNSRIILANQNVCAKELNIVLLSAFSSEEFKIVNDGSYKETLGREIELQRFQNLRNIARIQKQSTRYMKHMPFKFDF